MPLPKGTKRLFRFFSRSASDIDSDIRDEFAFHLEMRIEALKREGASDEDARAQARCEFGNASVGAQACAKEDAALERRRLLGRLAGELGQDARFGLRLIARNPGFSATAIITLALAIGGNTAVFSIVNALALQPLPVRAPQELARVYSGENRMSWPNFEDIRQHNRAFAEVAARNVTTLSMTTGDASVRLFGEVASASYLTMLGVSPLLGRTFGSNDRRTDVIVLGERAWRARFGGDPSIVGRMITLDGRSYEVLGVMPAGFRGVRPPGFTSDFWIPVDTSPSNDAVHDRGRNGCEVVARLKPGITFAAAQAEMAVLAQQLKAEYPRLPESFTRMEVFPASGVEGYRGMTRTLLPLFAFVGLMTIVTGFVLVVGCANIAGLLLGRGAARRREIGVRLALGAGRARLIRQMLTESLLLAIIGGAAGLLLAIWLGTAINGAVANLPVPIEFDLALDRRMLAYALALSIITSVLCGIVPARRATHFDVVPALKEDDPQRRRQRLRQTLVIGQVAISTVLLVWGALFLTSLANIHRVHPGFDASGVILANLVVDDENVRHAGGMSALVDELQTRTARLPGVQSTGIATIVPLAFTGREEYKVSLDGESPDSAGRFVLSNRVSPGWFETLRIGLIAGRDFGPLDRQGMPLVAVVNETLARTFWGGEAIGKHLWRGNESLEVVGVVRDSKYWTLGETTRPTLFTALAQTPVSDITLHVRTADLPAAMKAIRSEINDISPTLSAELKPMTMATAAAVLPARVGAIATSGFGALAAMLAMIGVYGLVSLTVAQRTREIGIRKAIGARTSDIISLVGRGTLFPVAAGLVSGLALGILGAFALRGFIVGVSPADPLTVAAAVALVVVAAVAASIVPALRAARVDPLVPLRAE